MMYWKLIAKLAIYGGTLLVGLTVGWLMAPSKPTELVNQSFHGGLTIEQFAELSELLVVKLDVSDVLVTHLQGQTGGIQTVVLVKGDVSLGIDLASARFDLVDTASRTAVLTLPQPTPSRPRLDHDRTRLVVIQKEGLWALSPSTAMYPVVTDQAMSEAQALVCSASNTQDASDRARRHAEVVLQAFFRSLDWKVRIVWNEAHRS